MSGPENRNVTISSARNLVPRASSPPPVAPRRAPLEQSDNVVTYPAAVPAIRPERRVSKPVRDLTDICMYDDLVPRDLRRRLSALIQEPIWKYGWKSSSRRDRYCFWHAHFAGGDGDSRRNCEAELAARPVCKPVYDLWEVLKAGPLAGHVPLRVYANSHTFGVEGYVHTDNRDTENYFSTIYYAHPVWHQNWAGDTVFYTRDQSDIVTSVYPKPGRTITFHGALPHCARAPSRDCTELRVSIVIKTQVADK